MKKADKDWLFSKVNTLREIRNGINNTLEYTDIFLSNSMILWLEVFIKEIGEKTLKLKENEFEKCKGCYIKNKEECLELFGSTICARELLTTKQLKEIHKKAVFDK